MLKAFITDFDGTLVDTFEANLFAYQQAFSEVGQRLTETQYRERFGYRYDRFMTSMGITDDEIANRIRELKKGYYPLYFDRLRPNTALIELIRSFRALGGITAIASTARRENLLAALRHIQAEDAFDLIYTGEDVAQGKPSPEIYNKAMAVLDVEPAETLIFEDSEVGLQAANASKAHVMKIIIDRTAL